MLSALNEAQVPVPSSATLAQIRQLYDDAVHAGEVMSARKPRANRVVLNDAPLEDSVMPTAAPHGEELGVLEGKLALLEVRQRIAQLEANKDDPTPPQSLPETVQTSLENLVGKFSGDDDEDIDKWFARLERAFVLYRAGEDTKCFSADTFGPNSKTLFGPSAKGSEGGTQML
uniref:Uncharacterized protein n=1 Tax=Anopheles atroparvus TaxID=41427 RepID=A0A182J4K9_ANOAO